jgi:hypothetical protein
MNKRQCIYCSIPLSECFGYVIPRDALLLLEGKWDFETMGWPREICSNKFSCNDKWKEFLRQENPGENFDKI